MLAALLLLSLSRPAAAQECPSLPALTTAALTAYQDAELDAARKAIERGYAALACQDHLLTTEQLLELYRLDGLVALSRGDNKTLTFATIRAVAADHQAGRPPDKYGPDLQAAYDTWVARLEQNLITVRVFDEGTLWVDGRPVDAANPRKVVAGEHVVQLPKGDDRVSTEVRDLAGDAGMLTGVGQVLPVPAPVPVPAPAVPAPLPRPVPAPVPPAAARRHPLPVAIAAGASGLLGGLALASAYRSEVLFHGSPYLAADYDRCARGSACYASARQRAIASDARSIDIAYGVGYGLVAVGGGLGLVTVVGLPPRRR
ncbi:MAG: hypothetical protein R2724_35090 [Bryobacterales bacterium]